MKKQKLIFSVIGGLGLYFLSTGVSFATFRYLNGPVVSKMISPVSLDEGRSKIDLTAPKTAECPLNGKMFTRSEQKIWGAKAPFDSND